MLRNWLYVYVGNFVGAVFVALFLSYWAEIVNVNVTGLAAQLGKASIRIAEAKVSISWLTLFLRGLGANWLVCLAVGLSIAADDVVGKIAGLWFPIMAFVAMGFEHSISNMFFIPLGMLNGANVTLWQFVVLNLVPVTLGNIVGGAVFVGAAYWWVYSHS